MFKKRNHLTSLLCLLLAVLLSAVALTACGGGSGSSAGTTGTSGGTEVPGDGTGSTTTDTQTPSTNWVDTLPEDLNYDGYEFVVGWSNPWGYNEIAFTYEDMLGDTINAAVYERNLLAEERLGITIGEYHMGEWNAVNEALTEVSMLGSDAPYSTICCSTWMLFTASLNGFLLPMNEIESINYENPWWDTEVIDMYSLDTDTFYFVSGDINYNDDYGLQCLYFNKELMTENQLAYPYQLVYDGDWTLDAMNTYLQIFPLDNGDTIYDENDTYGLVATKGALLGFADGFGETFISFEDGVASMNESERMFNIVADVVDMFSGNNAGNVVMERKFGYDVGHQIFRGGNGLFTFGMIGSILDYRYNMEDDFGVVPFPKYNEEQQSYFSSLTTSYGTAYAVTLGDSDNERTGIILDVMGYYSVDTITKEIVEKNAIFKGSRDDDTANMLHMLFDCKIYDLGGWGTTIYDAGMIIIETGVNTFASDVESVRNSTLAIFEKVAEFYQ